LVATRRVAQAIALLGCLASVENVGRPMSAEALARVTGVAAPTIRQLMQTLAHAALVSSVAGPHGGYWIACVPRETSMRVVIEAMEGPIDPGFCDLVGVACERIDHCTVHRLWGTAQEGFARDLTQLTLAEVLAPRVE
jgi:Rrf2 family protein